MNINVASTLLNRWKRTTKCWQKGKPPLLAFMSGSLNYEFISAEEKFIYVGGQAIKKLKMCTGHCHWIN